MFEELGAYVSGRESKTLADFENRLVRAAHPDVNQSRLVVVMYKGVLTAVLHTFVLTFVLCIYSEVVWALPSNHGMFRGAGVPA